MLSRVSSDWSKLYMSSSSVLLPPTYKCWNNNKTPAKGSPSFQNTPLPPVTLLPAPVTHRSRGGRQADRRNLSPHTLLTAALRINHRCHSDVTTEAITPTALFLHQGKSNASKLWLIPRGFMSMQYVAVQNELKIHGMNSAMPF